jgi:hypothetical protein
VNLGRTPPGFQPLPPDNNMQHLNDLDPPLQLISNAIFQQRQGRLTASVQGMCVPILPSFHVPKNRTCRILCVVVQLT